MNNKILLVRFRSERCTYTTIDAIMIKKNEKQCYELSSLYIKEDFD